MIPDYTPNIWSWLKSNTNMTDEGISAVMGNLWAESNCEPVRKQGDFNADRTPSKNYVASVDNGTLPVDSFSKDSAGFGLCQWTFWTRKAALYSYCVEKNKSIGDLTAQLEFMMKELKSDYTSLYNMLCSSRDIRMLCDEFMVKFENPYDKSDGAKLVRSNQAKGFFAQFSGKNVVVEEVKPSVQTTDIVSQLKTISACLNKIILILEEGG